MDFFVNIPILSMLLLLAGVLVGHMIWGRGRNEDDAELMRLRKQNENLRSEAEEQNRSIEQIQSSVDIHRKEAERYKKTSRQLDQLRDQNKTLQDALQQAEHNATRVQSLSDKLQTHVAAFHAERDQFVEAVQIRLAEQSKQLEKLTQERDEAVADLVEAKTEASGLKSTVQHQSKELEELRTKHAQAVGAESEATELRRQLEESATKLGRERHQREHLQSVLDGRKIEYDALMQDVEKLESSFQKMCLQNEKMAEDASMLSSLRAEQELLSKRFAEVTAAHRDVSEQRDQVVASEKKAVAQVVKLESRVQELEKIRIDNDHEVATLRAHLDESADLKRQLDEQKERLEQLVAELNDIGKAKSAAEMRVSTLEEEIEMQSQSLVALHQKSESKSQELRAANEEVERLTASGEQAAGTVVKLEARVRELEKSGVQSETELAKLKALHAEKVSELRDATDECEELISTNEHAEEKIAKLDGRIEELERQRNGLESDLAELKIQHDSKVAAWQAAVDDNTSAEEMIATLREQIEEIENTSGSRSLELSDLQSRHDETVEELRLAEAKADSDSESIARLTAQIENLQTRANTADVDILQLCAEYDEHTSKLQKSSSDREALVSKCVDAEATIERLELRIAELDQVRIETSSELSGMRERLSEAGELKRQLSEQNQRLESLVSERDDVARSKTEVEQRVQQLEKELQHQSNSVTSISEQHALLQERLQLETDRYSVAAAELADQKERVQQLQSELKELDTLRLEHGKLQAQLTDIKERLRAMTDDRDQRVENTSRLETTVIQLRQHNLANEDTIRDLRRERAAVIERLRQRAHAAIARPEPKPELKVVAFDQDENGGKMERDQVLGMVYTEAPEHSDDLKLIHGIATVLEQRLNEFGVYTYRQIMEWDESAIQEFSKLLTFKDRIDRDGWIAQATRLYEEKYGNNQQQRAA